MTKKQVVASLRSRVDVRREQFEALGTAALKQDDSLYLYYSGCIDTCDLILEFLCDYDSV